MGGTVRNMISWKLPALALALVGLVAAPQASAASLAASQTLVADTADTGSRDVVIAPMPDAAVQGAACLGVATASMATAYAIGPSELMMILTGAMHVPSGSAVMFIPMLSILGGGTCAMAAAATPAVLWAIDQSDAIGSQFSSVTDKWFGPGADLQYASAGADDAGKDTAAPTVRAMTEPETQGAGCVAGALAGFGASMATSPMEVAMLSSGATTIVSSTPLLGMALVGTIVASGCGIGALSALPITAFFNNFSAIGDSLVEGAGGAVQVAAGGVARAFALLGGGHAATIEVAEGAAR